MSSIHAARPRHAIALAALCLLGLAPALLAPAGAGAKSVVRSAHYEGTVSGGGSVSFYVSVFGDFVTSFSARNVPGSLCEIEYAEATPMSGDGYPIENDSFESFPLDFQFKFQGSFPSYQQASGTLSILSGGCVTGTKSWTASTTEGPPKGPTVSLHYRRTQPAVSRRAINLNVGCPNEDCRVSAEAHLSLGHNEFYELGSKRVLLTAGGSVSLKFKLKGNAVAAVRRAHREGRRKVRASVHVDCLNYEELMSTERWLTIWVK